MKQIEDRLIKEYELLIGLINRYGNAGVMIKGWTLTIVLAALGIKQTPDPAFHLVLIVAVFSLWLLEATYRNSGNTFKSRCKEIEEYFEDQKEFEISSPAINRTYSSKKSIRQLMLAALEFRVWPIYMILLVIIVIHYYDFI